MGPMPQNWLARRKREAGRRADQRNQLALFHELLVLRKIQGMESQLVPFRIIKRKTRKIVLDLAA